MRSLKIEDETAQRLRKLADNIGADADRLATQVITDYIDGEERFIALVKDRVRQADAGGPFVPQDEVWKRLGLGD